MDRFIHDKNLDHFRKKLAETTDERQRQQLLKLLAEEEAKDLHRPRAADSPYSGSRSY